MASTLHLFAPSLLAAATSDSQDSGSAALTVKCVHRPQELIDGLQLMDRANGKGAATKHSILLAVREHDLQVGALRVVVEQRTVLEKGCG